MPKEILDEDEKLFAVSFADTEKRFMKVILMFYGMMILTDDEKDGEMKDFIVQAGSIIAEGIEETPDNEEILLPLDGLSIVYHSLAASANILLTPNVKDGFAKLLKVNKMKAEPADVEAFCREAKLMSQRKIDNINQKHEHEPEMKQMRSSVEKTWRGVARMRLMDKK